jgi:hypothetical protein
MTALGHSLRFGRVPMLPVYPYKQTSLPCVGMSQMLPKADINSRLRRPFGGTGLPVHQVSFHVRLRKDCGRILLAARLHTEKWRWACNVCC